MNARTPATYRRLILDFGQGMPDAAIVRTAAELARLLGVDLHGLFIEDEALLTLAAWPFARELRLPTQEWHPIDLETVSAQLRAAAAAADRLLAEAVAALDIPGHFEVIRGDPIAAIAAFCRGDDILVLAPPRSAPGLGRPREAPRGPAAHRRAAGAVLVVPRGRARRPGPVVAALADATDPGLDLAARIAAATAEDVRVLLPDPAPAAQRQVRDRAVALGVAPARIQIQPLLRDPATGAVMEDLPAALVGAPESLIVLGRGLAPDTEAAVRLATRRGVPVLVMEAGPTDERPRTG